MKRRNHWKACAILICAAVWASQVTADCGRQIAPAGPPARTIVLAGGDAWTLFRQFLAEVEQRDLDVSLKKSRVILSRNGRVETIELGVSASFSLRAPEQQWQRSLAGKRADLNPRLLADARVSHWDIVCRGDVRPEGQQQAARPPQEAMIFFKSGMQYASRGDYGNALKEFKAVEKIAPRFEGLSMNLGVAYLQLRDYVRASEYLRRAIEQNPRNAAAHYNMACLQARLGQSADAVASLSSAKAAGMKMTPALKKDPDLSSLRGRRDFETLFQ